MHQHAVQTTGIVSLCVKRRSRTGATPITAVVLCLFVFLFIFFGHSGFVLKTRSALSYGQINGQTSVRRSKRTGRHRRQVCVTCYARRWTSMLHENACLRRIGSNCLPGKTSGPSRPYLSIYLFFLFFFEKGEFHIVGYMKIYKSCGGTTVQWISWWWVERRTQSLYQFSNRWWKTFHDSRGYIAWAEQKRKSFITGAIDVYCTRGHVFLEQPARRLGWPQYTKPKLEKRKIIRE